MNYLAPPGRTDLPVRPGMYGFPGVVSCVRDGFLSGCGEGCWTVFLVSFYHAPG